MTSQIGLIKAHDLNRPADAADALVQVSSIFGSADFSVHVCHIGADPNSAIAFRLCRFQSGRRALFQPEEQQSRGCGSRFSESYPGTSGLDGGWGDGGQRLARSAEWHSSFVAAQRGCRVDSDQSRNRSPP